MAPVFASPDIAALVAAFPPPIPTNDRPSLVKSHSGNNLLDSRKVLARFRVLLETSAGRVKKVDLPSRLDIENAEWLLDCYNGELYYSKDLQTLLSLKEAQELVQRMRVRARDELVDVATFVSEQDISRQSCDRLLADEFDLRHFSLGDTKHVVGQVLLVDRLKEQIMSEVASANGDKLHLSSTYPSTPSYVLLTVAKEAIEQSGDIGSLITEGERVVYTPANYETLQAEKQEELYKTEVEAALNDLGIDGYCEIRDDATARNSHPEDGKRDLGADVMDKFQTEHSEVEMTSFDQAGKGTTSTSLVVARADDVEKAMKQLHEIIQNFVHTNQQTDHASLASLEPSLRDETSHLGLTQRLLKSTEHRKLLEASLASAKQAVEDKQSQKFQVLCREKHLAPLELYAQGPNIVPDQTLNERLSQYVCEHFRNEIIPGLAKSLRDAGLLSDKARAKDLEKLTAASTEAKTVAELQAAASKFCRKQKIATPDSSQLSRVKGDILREKTNSLQKMTRASDVLQNLIWLLLAQRRDGLFLSAGKDTTRMVKLYQSVGDAEKAQKLERWRDVLKAGQQTDEDVQQMKAMAAEVIASMYGDEDARREE